MSLIIIVHQVSTRDMAAAAWICRIRAHESAWFPMQEPPSHPEADFFGPQEHIRDFSIGPLCRFEKRDWSLDRSAAMVQTWHVEAVAGRSCSGPSQ